MLNNIAIGLFVTLDPQTRTLTRLSDGKSVSLPASASLCLEALAVAKGEVLSQEQLMDIGWRSSGVEVTDNSVRVMINKLRRALTDLDLQNEVTLLAVTRSGYRLIVRESATAPVAESAPVPETAAAAAAAAPSPNPVTSAPYQPASLPVKAEKVPAMRLPRSWNKRIQATLAGVIAGLVVSLLLHQLFIVKPIEVDFVPWYGPEIPPNTEVRVPKDKRDWDPLIEATLNTYSRYVLAERPTEKPARVLYLTLAASKNNLHQGLIACQQPLQDSKNDCESYYFRVY